MNKEILNTFSELLKEFEKGLISLQCKDGKPWEFHMKMNYQIYEKNKIYTNTTDDSIPTLRIKNLEKFIELLEKSVQARWDTHRNELEEINMETYEFEPLNEESYLKYLISMTFINMNEMDFQNPNKYLESLIKSYQKENQIFNKPIKSTIQIENKSYSLELLKKQEQINMESPYSYTFKLSNEEETFYFPSIYAVKNDNKLIVRAIKNDKKLKSSLVLKEKIEKYIKDNFPKDGLNNKKVSYLRRVNPSFVLALNMFIELSEEQHNIQEIEFPLFAPQRYNNKRDTIIYKAGNITKEELENIEENLDDIQFHMSDVLAFNALRMQYHLPRYQITDYGDISSHLCLKIEQSQESKDNIFKSFSAIKQKRKP